MNDSEKTGPFYPSPPEPSIASSADLKIIGRYRIERILGEGGFGCVYLAYDDELQRPVAVKVPHIRRIKNPEDIDAYLAEARNLALLDHPNIVPVYDFGRTSNGLCFVVSKFIEGRDLSKTILSGRKPYHWAAELISTIAEALHHSHLKGLVHRDVKPGNILLDTDDKPYLADFGLALREEDFGKGTMYLGSPAYMSPEQARGEGHRVDGRSDIFSLGVVFYELLTGRRPFEAESREKIRQLISYFEPRPPRQIEDKIPKELERICLIALAIRASDRYTAAIDLANDLRCFLAEKACEEYKPASKSSLPTNPQAIETVGDLFARTPSSSKDFNPVKVVPKGLISFNAHDADFFLELLPGPRDREGLPDSIRFWKLRIEELNPNKTFAVGLIYGPSGCGKSSLVKAGLLPRIPKQLALSVYVEATSDDTETRLLTGLRNVCPDLPNDLGLTETLAALRKDKGAFSGPKVVIILDQFEQWLHARKEDENAELILALRQCDGRRVMCILMVRDDFWLPVIRLMQALEVRFVEGESSRLVDLFDLRHARKVLAMFGTAFGALPETGRTREQEAFLDQAVASLAEEGKIIPVRLALFAEMVKGKPWALSTLKEFGGTNGLGVAFLDETFMGLSAPAHHRLHQKAAQSVLKALLPHAGANIKGSMRSYQDLLECSGYVDQPQNFAELMHILDGEVRLLTPTAPEIGGEGGSPQIPVESKYYQLTHDYLVPSLREWLTRNQNQTWRGRAERRLADRTTLWFARPESRQLPSMIEWLEIRQLTDPRAWAEPERQMMRAATSKHRANLTWLGLAASLIIGVLFFLNDLIAKDRASSQAKALVLRLLDSNISETPIIIRDLADFRPWVDPVLTQIVSDASVRRDHRLRSLLALLPAYPHYAEPLRNELLDSDPTDFMIIRDALIPHAEALRSGLWDLLEKNESDPKKRFKAAAALATYDPENPRWKPIGSWVSKQMIVQPSLVLPRWVDAMRPVKSYLTPEFAVLFMGEPTPVTAAIIADYAADQFDVQAKIVAKAPPDSFGLLFPLMEKNPIRAIPALIAEMDRPPVAGGNPNELAGSRANLGIALLRLGAGERFWPLLKNSPEPRCRSYAIDLLGPLGCPPDLLWRQIPKADEDLRSAMIQALGRYDELSLPPTLRAELSTKIAQFHREDESPAVHASARWLLGQWGQRNDEVPVKVRDSKSRWYVNSAGITMVRIESPGTFLMGNLPDQPGWEKEENQHPVSLGYSFDIGMTEVTRGQFQQFQKERGFKDNSGPNLITSNQSAEEPVSKIKWYDAAAFCNWLSEKDGLAPDQWCYEPNSNGKFEEGMKIVAGLKHRTGYRLPTEAEWEYCCRGGAITTRCYGDSDELLPRYAWYAANSFEKKMPVAMLLPNAFGLFDMHGNASEWCLDETRSYENPRKDNNLEETIWSKDYRIVRGGHSISIGLAIHSARRFSDRPSINSAGFRIARSQP